MELAWRICVTLKHLTFRAMAMKKRRQRRCAGGQYISSKATGGYYSSTAKKSRRKTYRTKRAAKKNKPGNMSVYPVSGGYRRSKRRQPAPF